MLIGAAMARAADRAYDFVRDPAEGTILTVMREMAHRVAGELPHGASASGRPTPTHEQKRRAGGVVEPSLAAGQDSVRRSPECSTCCAKPASSMRAATRSRSSSRAIAALRGDDRPSSSTTLRPLRASPTPSMFHRPFGSARTSRSPARGSCHPVRPGTRGLGDSVLVVGDPDDASACTSTQMTRGPPTAVFDGAGEVSHLDIADMHEQMGDRSRRLASAAFPGAGPTCACSPWSRGWRTELFASLGALTSTAARPSTRRPTTCSPASMPSPAEEVVVLPNSPNVIMAAERAAELSDKEVVVIPSRSQQAGLAAVVALDPARTARRTLRRWRRCSALVRTGGVAPAARDDARAASRPAMRSASSTRSSLRGAIRRRPAFVLDALAAGAELSPASRATTRRSTARRHRARPGGRRARAPRGRSARLVVADQRRVGTGPSAIVGAGMPPTIPPAFAGREPLDRAALRAAPGARRDRPSSPRGSSWRWRAREGGRAARAAHRRRPARAPAARRREARTIAALAPGEQATVVVEVRSITSRSVRRRGMRPLVEAVVADGTGVMKAAFFNQPWLSAVPARDAARPPRHLRRAQQL